jgi:hypothetical protein
MNIHNEKGAQSDAVKQQLEREGWRVDRKQDGSMLATNSEMQEPEARRRLDQMGLLTSSMIRIEFVISKDPEL